MKTIAYLRVSTADQDCGKFELDIRRFADDHNFSNLTFVSEKVSGLKSWKHRKLYEIVQSLQQGDVLIVPELSRLGRSLVEILEVLNLLRSKDVKVFSVKEAFQLNGDDMQSKMMSTLLGLFAEIEHDLIVSRTKEGLIAARDQGKILGRPKGIGKSKLDAHRDEIINLVKNGSRKNFIAKRFGVTPSTVGHWLHRHKLNYLKAEP